MKVLPDANVILRTLLPSDNPERAATVLLRAGYTRRLTLLTTDELLDEVRRKATSKPALAGQISPASLNDALTTLSRRSIVLPRLLPPFPRVCRDDKDDYLLAYAASGQADVLATYDDDLLVLDDRFPFRILRPPDLLAVLREQGLV